MNTPYSNTYDFILAGGGLQAGLLATAINHCQPTARILMIERNDRLCGNHTWSFHASDIEQLDSDWLQSLPLKQWPGYTVKFERLERKLDLGYCSLTSTNLERKLFEIAGAGQLEIKTNTRITKLESHSVQTSDGLAYRAEMLIDCRGLRSNDESSGCGYQKFHGFEIELENQDWPDSLPVLLDATLDQRSGFRFMYVLPLTNRRVLIEDTHFADNRELAREQSLAEVKNYLSKRRIGDWTIVREERGCLPMPYSNHMRPSLSVPLRGGYAGGWFHAATGYSFPLAARFADEIASSPAEQIPKRIARLAQSNRFQATFSRFLNRLLFRLVPPEKRWMILRRFYQVLPEGTIKRFYSHQFTVLDAARIIVGSPMHSLKLSLELGLTPFRFLQSFGSDPQSSLQGGRFPFTLK